jgi:GNAT superfamily N-acetyltransferase
MIIRNLKIEECERLAEIDPSFETDKIYKMAVSDPFEPRIVVVNGDPPVEVMPPIFGSTSPNAAGQYREQFDKYDLFIVAEDEGRIVGASCSMPLTTKSIGIPGYVAMPGEYFLSGLAVDRDWRGKGIGRALIDRVKERCLDVGCSMISLWAGFDYYPAIAYYLQNGFSISGWLHPPGCRYDQCRLYLTWLPD